MDNILELYGTGGMSREDAIEWLKVIDPPEELKDHPVCYGISSTGWQLRIINCGGNEALVNLWNEGEIDVEQINECLNTFGITTPEQKRIFFAQCSQETGCGMYFIESGNSDRYRGAGAIQLTHEDNYTKFYNYLKSQGIDDPSINEGDGTREPYQVVAEDYPWLASGFWWDY